MTELEILKWIKRNLSAPISDAVKGSDYTEDHLAAMAMREVGFLIARYASKGYLPENMHVLMKGDYGQRDGETEKQYHGYSYWQIDIDSYPDFIKSGNWKSPYSACIKAVSVLNEKKDYLKKQFPSLGGPKLEDAVTAAYNCGQGNVTKALRAGKDVDIFTFNKDYSKEVRRFRGMYLALPL